MALSPLQYSNRSLQTAQIQHVLGKIKSDDVAGEEVQAEEIVVRGIDDELVVDLAIEGGLREAGFHHAKAFAGGELAYPIGPLAMPGALEERWLDDGIDGAAGVHLVERGASAEKIRLDENAAPYRLKGVGVAQLRSDRALGIEETDGVRREIELDAIVPQDIESEDAIDAAPGPDAPQVIAPHPRAIEQEGIVQEEPRGVVNLQARRAGPGILDRLGAERRAQLAADGTVENGNRRSGIDEEAPVVALLALQAQTKHPVRTQSAIERSFRWQAGTQRVRRHQRGHGGGAGNEEQAGERSEEEEKERTEIHARGGR